MSRLPSCPGHLTAPAAREWRRVSRVLRDAGVLTAADTAALAAYCQAWGRWVEAEERLQEAQMLYRTPSGHVQQSPWLGIIHKQLELMGRYMIELGMTPASRSRAAAIAAPQEPFNVWLERLAAEMTREEQASAVIEARPVIPALSAARA